MAWQRKKLSEFQDNEGNIHRLESNYEVLFAKLLDELKDENKILSWRDHCNTFHFTHRKIARRYTPDFCILLADETTDENVNVYVEVKGFMDKRSEMVVNRFKKTHPTIPFAVITRDFFHKSKKNNVETITLNSSEVLCSLWIAVGEAKNA